MAIYYVKHSGGSDSNDGLSVANAFATIQKATDTCDAGSSIYILATGTHTPGAEIELDIKTGSANDPINIFGADASGTLLTGSNMATISGSSLSSGDHIFLANTSGGSYYRLNNIRMTASPLSCVSASNANSNGGTSWVCMNCRFDNNGYNSFEVGRTGSPGTRVTAINCEFDNNGNDGIGYITTNRGNWYLTGCRIHNNANNGVSSRGHNRIVNCLIYGNGGKGAFMSTYSVEMWGNTIYDNGSHGIQNHRGDWYTAIHNNIIAGNGGYGLYSATTSYDELEVHNANNLFHNNSSGTSNTGAVAVLGINNIEADPDFVSTTEGNADFLRPSADSPAKGAGLNGTDIGSVASAGGGGGGGTVGFAL